MTDLHNQMLAMGDRSLVAARQLALLGSPKRNKILQGMADELDACAPELKKVNVADMKLARESGMSAPLLDRLELSSDRIAAMANSIREVAGLKDPVGAEISRWIRPNGLNIVKVRVPIGVIGMIYESRPNVTADAAALCVKSANAVILRGGGDALLSNVLIAEALQAGGEKKGLPAFSVQLIANRDHEAVRELVQLEGRVDLIIPRGGESLIRAVIEQAHVPVIKHYKGICHTYVDKSADLEMALRIVENAKCQRPGVCNAIETLLVHKEVAPRFLPILADTLGKHKVELRGDAATRQIIASAMPATEKDWSTEYLDLILAIKVVASVASAVRHINRYGSRHSDAIIAESEAAQKSFLDKVDSAVVYVNASTRFTDGGEFGMGAEIGISTDKLHARGPMGLEELTTYKYKVFGNGQVRE
jgi:glutamate-5-semialdehyde dehydrogenase